MGFAIKAVAASVLLASAGGAFAQKGDTVMPGELVGLVGNTGHSFGSHLHLEFQKSVATDSPIDPIAWLKRHGLN